MRPTWSRRARSCRRHAHLVLLVQGGAAPKGPRAGGGSPAGARGREAGIHGQAAARAVRRRPRARPISRNRTASSRARKSQPSRRIHPPLPPAVCPDPVAEEPLSVAPVRLEAFDWPSDVDVEVPPEAELVLHVGVPVPPVPTWAGWAAVPVLPVLPWAPQWLTDPSCPFEPAVACPVDALASLPGCDELPAETDIG